MYFSFNKAFVDPTNFRQDNFRYLQTAVVESVYDESGMGRIKARINGPVELGGDADLPTFAKVSALGLSDGQEIPYAFPLLPKHLSTIPKVGEVVWIFVMGRNTNGADRLYIGPIISQLDKLNEDRFKAGTALRPFTFGQLYPSPPVLTDDTTNKIIPELIGVFPKSDEISIQGRYNTDITQKRNEVVIRAGKFESSNSNKYQIAFNSKTQGFIQIKNDVSYPSSNGSEGNDKGSVTNIVANKINLLTHRDGAPTITINNNDLISDEELKMVLKDAHQLPFGDILLEYLKLLKEAIFYHVHNGNGNPSTDLSGSGNCQPIAALKAQADDLEKRMLSKNIRIN
jgi:hypothetical protein